MAIRVEFKPVQQQIRTLASTPAPVTGTVVDEKPGPVTRIDKAKAYYKGLIALIGSLLIGANQVLPIVPADAKGAVSTAIAFLTVVSVILKANENWVEDL